VLDVWGQGGVLHMIPVAGHSMLPLLQNGDQVVVAHGWASGRRGDVVVFRRGDALVVHRVLRMYNGNSEPMVITKGDNLSYFDAPLGANDIVGRVLAIKRGGRRLPLDTPVWRILGWLIAVSAWGWQALDGWSQRCEQRRVAPQMKRRLAFLRRSAWAIYSRALIGVQEVLRRWYA